MFGIATVLADWVTEIPLKYRILVVFFMFVPLLLPRIPVVSEYATKCLVQYGLKKIESEEQLHNQVMRLRQRGLEEEEFEAFVQEEIPELDYQGVPERLYQEMKDDPSSIRYE
jgi:hypothetical protein